MRRLFAILLLAMLTSACGGGESTTSEGPDTDAADTATADDTATTAPPETTTAPSTTTTVATTTTTEAPTAVSQVPKPEASTVADLLSLDRPVVAATAAASLLPHSTMYAFVEAALAGTDVLEMDLQMTADGVLVVHHDATVDRRTKRPDGCATSPLSNFRNSTRPIGSTTAAKSETSPTTSTRSGMRTGDVEPPAGYTADDFKIETFRTLAETFPDHVLDLEIKVPLDDDGESDVARDRGRPGTRRRDLGTRPVRFGDRHLILE